MLLVDTHSHIYLDNFKDDRIETIHKAFENGVKYIILPNIDSSSIKSLLELRNLFPENCFPLMGLHPTSVKKGFEKELELIESWLEKEKFYGIGETGIDLYWDKTYLNEQIIAFEKQIELAIQYDLPIVIHSRESFNEIFNILEKKNTKELRGVFHSFSGNLFQAEKAISFGLKLGIGGIVTFKNSGLDKIVENIAPEHIVLETDSPFLAPVPHRGKRNEPSYLVHIGMKLAAIYKMDFDSIIKITTNNSIKLFKIDCNF
ncbi:TatD family hydrolase [Bacteroidota bacterium]